MEPYYAHQQTFGPVHNGVDRNGSQLYGLGNPSIPLHPPSLLVGVFLGVFAFVFVKEYVTGQPGR